MEGHRESYHSHIRYHAAFHGVKMPEYVSQETIIEKANRLDEIMEAERLAKEKAKNDNT